MATLTRAQLISEVNANIVDNTTGADTPAIVRTTLIDMLNNIWTLQDAQTVAGAIAFPSGSSINLSGILVGNGGSAITGLTAGQIPGEPSTGSASSGNIGEYITATGTSVSLTTATPATITSISLSAGDWDVWGILNFVPAASTTVSLIQAATNTTTNIFPASAVSGGLHQIQATLTTGVNQTIPVGMERYSVAGATTVYLVAQANFATSTLQANGKIAARRAR